MRATVWNDQTMLAPPIELMATFSGPASKAARLQQSVQVFKPDSLWILFDAAAQLVALGHNAMIPYMVAEGKGAATEQTR